MVLVLRLGCQRCGADSGACKRILSEVGRRYDVIRAGLPAVIAVDITPTIVDGERTCPGHRRCQPDHRPTRFPTVLPSCAHPELEKVMGMSGSGLLPRTRLEQLVRQLRRTVAEFQKDFARTSDQLDERAHRVNPAGGTLDRG